ncbi:MAG: 1,6-anhydro-N-acetylmuramyl-L-alanine amidase AmpD [Gammaproteobacteria bacterium]|nr:1,6-anhydro-N-acetylmuramyl-L-alanine amidase AmpD [Gammaproteobacteria bacterium]
MKLNTETGLLESVLQHRSPNQDERPQGEVISLLVIHGISLPPGQYGGGWIDDLFMNQLDSSAHPYFSQLEGLKVSTHVLIRRDGEVIQYVPFVARAWHAGVSAFQGRQHCNDYSIGIELEGQDDEPYTDIQYQQLIELKDFLMGHYPAIHSERVVGHSDIAPGRKSDPGSAFEWARLELF